MNIKMAIPLYIYATDLAVILQINKYQNINDIILKIWKRFDRTNYNEMTEKLKNVGKIKQIVTDEKNIKQIMTKLSPSDSKLIDNHITKCLKSKNTASIMKEREKIFNKIKLCNNLDDNTKNELKKSITGMTNKRFGIREEINVLDEYRKLVKNDVISVNKIIKKEIICSDQDNKRKYYLAGKIDGIQLCDNGNIIVEIKNRIYKLFYKLRDYEKIQVMTYLYIFDMKNADLVERLKLKDKSELNIIRVEFDNDIWDNIIYPGINYFIQFYQSFLQNNELKSKLLIEGDISVHYNCI